MARPRNWILTLTRNALALTKVAIPSMLEQSGLDGELRLLVVDNGSSDNTLNYLLALGPPVTVIPIRIQHGVAHGWNTGLRHAFSAGAEHVLVCNNDIWLRPDTYAGLLAVGGSGFTTAVGVHSSQRKVLAADVDLTARRPHPDFSCFLMHRSTFDTVGPFDEHFRIAYGEDCDYHVRMHLAGVRAESVSLPFLHVDGGSGTLKSAAAGEREDIQRQALINREYFYRKWNFDIGSPEYEAFFKLPGETTRTNPERGRLLGITI